MQLLIIDLSPAGAAVIIFIMYDVREWRTSEFVYIEAGHGILKGLVKITQLLC